MPDKLKVIAASPELFLKIFLNSKQQILKIGLSEKEMFSHLETLEMVCLAHTMLISNPFALTIFDGYLHSYYSAQEMNNSCMLPYLNPYLGHPE